jgi:hypothetical protein
LVILNYNMSIEDLRMFSAASMNNDENKHLWIKGASLFISQMNAFVKHNNYLFKHLNITTFDNKEKDEIGRILNENKSDKAYPHNYHYVYAYIFNKLGKESRLNVLEVGLGTNNPTIVSSMGIYGRPGASLYAFKQYLPNSQIFGCDIDKDILFQTDRIKTCYIDQLDMSTFDNIAKTFGKQKYDLIIDDGLHSIGANLNTLLFALENVNDNGWIVIEDIGLDTASNWTAIDYVLNQNKKYETFMINEETGKGYLYVVHKL